MRNAIFAEKKKPAAAGKTSTGLIHDIKSQEHHVRQTKKRLRQSWRPHQATIHKWLRLFLWLGHFLADLSCDRACYHRITILPVNRLFAMTWFMGCKGGGGLWGPSRIVPGGEGREGKGSRTEEGGEIQVLGPGPGAPGHALALKRGDGYVDIL